MRVLVVDGDVAQAYRRLTRELVGDLNRVKARRHFISAKQRRRRKDHQAELRQRRAARKAAW